MDSEYPTCTLELPLEQALPLLGFKAGAELKLPMLHVKYGEKVEEAAKASNDTALETAGKFLMVYRSIT